MLACMVAERSRQTANSSLARGTQCYALHPKGHGRPIPTRRASPPQAVSWDVPVGTKRRSTRPGSPTRNHSIRQSNRVRVAIVADCALSKMCQFQMQIVEVPARGSRYARSDFVGGDIRGLRRLREGEPTYCCSSWDGNEGACIGVST